eukprot:gene12878-biopygen505
MVALLQPAQPVRLGRLSAMVQPCSTVHRHISRGTPRRGKGAGRRSCTHDSGDRGMRDTRARRARGRSAALAAAFSVVADGCDDHQIKGTCILTMLKPDGRGSYRARPSFRAPSVSPP